MTKCCLAQQIESLHFKNVQMELLIGAPFCVISEVRNFHTIKVIHAWNVISTQTYLHTSFMRCALA